jgi:hypothetical protein
MHRNVMALAVVIAVLLIAYGSYIARSQTIRLTVDSDPAALSQRTANGIAAVFIVFGFALLLICGSAMLFARP